MIYPILDELLLTTQIVYKKIVRHPDPNHGDCYEKIMVYYPIFSLLTLKVISNASDRPADLQTYLLLIMITGTNPQH